MNDPLFHDDVCALFTLLLCGKVAFHRPSKRTVHVERVDSRTGYVVVRDAYRWNDPKADEFVLARDLEPPE